MYLNNKVVLIADVGINANGDMAIVKKLIDSVNACGWDYVKFQKRNRPRPLQTQQNRLTKAEALPEKAGTIRGERKEGIRIWPFGFAVHCPDAPRSLLAVTIAPAFGDYPHLHQPIRWGKTPK